MADSKARQERDDWRSRFAITVVGLVLLLNHTDRIILGILLEPIKRDFELSDGQVGLLTGPAFAIAYALLVIPIARLAERRSRVSIVTVCVLVWSAATFTTGLAGGFLALIVARVVLGAAEAGGIAPSMSVVSDLFPAQRRAAAMSVFALGASVAVLIAPIIGGALISLVGWRGTFIALGLAGVPIALLLALGVREPKRGLGDGLAGPPVKIPFAQSLRRLFGRPSYVFLVAGYVLWALAQFAVLLWLPAFFQRSYGIEPAQLGAKLALYQGLPLLAGNIFGGFLADRLSRRDQRWPVWMMMLASLITAFSMAALFTVKIEAIAFALLTAPSLAQGLSAGAGYALTQNLSGVHSRATSVAVLAFCVTIVGAGLGPLLLGMLSQFLSAEYGPESLRYAFFAVCPIYACAAGALWMMSRYVTFDLEDARRDSAGAAAGPANR